MVAITRRVNRWVRPWKAVRHHLGMELQLRRELAALNRFTVGRVDELLAAQEILESRSRQLELLTATAAINFEEPDPKVAAFRILQRVMAILDMDAAELWVVDRENGRVLRVSQRGLPSGEDGGPASLGLGEDFPGLAAASGEPVVSDRPAQDPRLHRQSIKDAGFQCFAAVPVKAGESPVAVLCVASRRPRPWAEEHTYFLEGVGKVLGRRTMGLLLRGFIQ